MRNTVLYGDCLARLEEIPSETVQTCVTSPPYWGLRDYGVQGQVGMEEDPNEYIAKLVETFRRVRRTLKEDGTLWLNIGDTYNSSPSNMQGGIVERKGYNQGYNAIGRRKRQVAGLKPKDLMMIPARVALALQADGWWVRSDIIWSKPNVMPESVEDRPSTAHEHVFLLTKNAAYFYNADAIRERSVEMDRPQSEKRRLQRMNRGVVSVSGCGQTSKGVDGGVEPTHVMESNPLGRNARTVWTISTTPYKGAHFAVMPPELAVRCIKAGSNLGDLVLDPFAGSGTTLETAKDLDRDFLGIELNESYRALIEERLQPALTRAEERSIFRFAMGET